MTAVKTRKPVSSPENKLRALAAKRAAAGLPVGHDPLMKLLRSTERKGEVQR